ncbi:MAG: type II secretion system protein GspM, partial [Plesiomonas shigelloides]
SYSISVTRMQAQDRQVQLWVADLPFNQLLSWLLRLRLQYGIEVAALDLSLAGQGGVVRVDRLQLALP